MQNRSFADLAKLLKKFSDERDWEQFHYPKNLAMALTVEAAELLEHFQWMTENESEKLSAEKLQQIQEEIGDVLIYLTRFADRLGIDALEAAYQKLEINRVKYPIEKARGSAKKYTEL